jgi:hypothetical protein
MAEQELCSSKHQEIVDTETIEGVQGSKSQVVETHVLTRCDVM